MAIKRGGGHLAAYTAGRDFGPNIRLKPEKSERAMSAPGPANVTPLQKRQALAAFVHVDPLRIIEKEDRFDPALPNGGYTRGGRVRDPLLRMFEAHHISKQQWDGVEGFRDDLALAEGARLNQSEQSSIKSTSSARNWPSEVQCMAMRRITVTLTKIDMQNKFLLNWTVVEHRTLGEYARHQHMHTDKASQQLHELMDFVATRHGPGRLA